MADNRDIQAEINAIKAVNPNDPRISQLQAERDQKLRDMYGNDYQAGMNSVGQNSPLYADLARLRQEKLNNTGSPISPGGLAGSVFGTMINAGVNAANGTPPTGAQVGQNLVGNITGNPMPLPTPTTPTPTTNTPPTNSITDLTTLVNKLLEQNNNNQQQYANQVQQNIANVNRIMSPDNFDTILAAILKQYMPMMDAQKAESAEQLKESNRLTDIDAEKRGLFNSGVASEMQRRNKVDADRNLATVLATLQKEATGNAKDTVNQQLQAANITSGMLGDLNKAGTSGLEQALNAAFGLNTAQNKNWETVLTSQRIKNDYDIALKNIENDKTKLGYEKERLKLEKLSMDLEQGKFDEGIRQFNEEMALKRQLRIDDINKFTKQFNASSADSKAALINAQANMLRAQVDEKKFMSEEEMLTFQKNMDTYTKLQEGYKFVASMKDGIMSGTMPKDDAVALIKPYEQLDKMYPGIYKEMLNTVKGYTDTKEQDDRVRAYDKEEFMEDMAKAGYTPPPTFTKTPSPSKTPSPVTTPAPRR